MRALLTIAAVAATLATTSTSNAQSNTIPYYPWCAVETASREGGERRSCGFTSYALAATGMHLRRSAMRALLAIAALAATLATTSASQAQTDAPAYYPWCALDTVASDVVRRSCGFTSYAQCMNSVRGQNGISRNHANDCPL